MGLDKDIQTLKKKDLDGYGLFLGDLISHHIGKDFHSYIHIDFPEVDGVVICWIYVEIAKKPAYVREGGRSQYFVRTHNSTQELDAKETYDYISTHFS